MIIGIGTDLCTISRIDAAYGRFGERFLDRICTPDERQHIMRNSLKMIPRLAQHFAAKEACAKALGTGFSQGVYWSGLEVSHLPSGQPTFILHGGAHARALALIPRGYRPQVHISLSDEADLAHAMVIISAIR
ncbi:MAG: holo-ACP synthase [Pseudomonadota bacterium]